MGRDLQSPVLLMKTGTLTRTPEQEREERGRRAGREREESVRRSGEESGEECGGEPPEM